MTGQKCVIKGRSAELFFCAARSHCFVFRDKILGKSWGHKLIFLNFQHHHRFRPFPRRAHNRPAGARGANENPPVAIAVPIYPP